MDIKAMVHAWFSLLADFLRFFGNEELNKLADAMEEQMAKADEE